MNIDNIKLAIDHSQQLRLWICGNQPKLSYGDRIDLLVHKDFNEVVISNYINPDDLKDILEPLNTSKRNVLVSIPDMNVELPRGFIRNKELKKIQYGYLTFGVRYDNHFDNGVQRRDIQFTANSITTLEEIGRRLKLSDNLKDMDTRSVYLVGIQENRHCRFEIDESCVLLADVWTPHLILIFSNQN